MTTPTLMRDVILWGFDDRSHLEITRSDGTSRTYTIARSEDEGFEAHLTVRGREFVLQHRRKTLTFAEAKRLVVKLELEGIGCNPTNLDELLDQVSGDPLPLTDFDTLKGA